MNRIAVDASIESISEKFYIEPISGSSSIEEVSVNAKVIGCYVAMHALGITAGAYGVIGDDGLFYAYGIMEEYK